MRSETITWAELEGFKRDLICELNKAFDDKAEEFKNSVREIMNESMDEFREVIKDALSDHRVGIDDQSLEYVEKIMAKAVKGIINAKEKQAPKSKEKPKKRARK